MGKTLFRWLCLVVTLSLLVTSFAACGKDDGFDEIPDDPDVGNISADVKYGYYDPTVAQVVGSRVFTYQGYLGYGYNLLTAAYYNSMDVGKDYPVVDMDSLAAAGNVYIDYDCADARADYVVARSTREYSSSLSASAHLEGRVGLTGSFEASFSMSHSSQINSDQMLVTSFNKLIKRNEFICIRNDADISNYLSDCFLSDLAAQDFNAAALVTRYGTHVMKSIYMGGRFELNYLYTNSSSKSRSYVEAAAKASNAFVSGGASGSMSTEVSELSTNSSCVIHSRGGSVNVSATSLEAARESYARWASSVDADNVTLIDCDSLIPLQTLIAASGVEGAAEKAAAVAEYINSRSSSISGEFGASTFLYIKDILVGRGLTKNAALADLYEQGCYDSQIMKLDMNDKAGGYFIYLAFVMTDDPDEAITGLVARYSTQSGGAQVKVGGITYSPIGKNLKMGLNNQFVYLYYTRDKKAGAPISNITYQLNSDYENGSEPTGYKQIMKYESDRAMEFNCGLGPNRIYLWYLQD